MIQPVPAPDSSELASMLEEVSGLASQIVNLSDKLRTISQGDTFACSANAYVLLPAALSHAENCLSLLRFVGQAPVSPPPPSPFIPPAFGWPNSSTPISITTLVPQDPLFTSRPNTPATQKWPLSLTSLPPVETVFGLSAPSAPRVRSANENSPLSPALNEAPTRHRISIAELVDEEGSSTGTIGGVNHSSLPAPADLDMSAAQNYPPLSICIVDVTPHPAETSEGLDVLGTSRSRPSPHSPPVPPNSHRRSTASEGGGTLRRSKRKGVLLQASGISEQRVTRSRAKRKTTEDIEIGTSPPKRARTSSP